MRIFIAACVLLASLIPSHAQNVNPLVVQSCGTVPSPYVAGNAIPLTVDTTGAVCNGTTSATGGSASAAAPNVSGLGVTSCGAQSLTPGQYAPLSLDLHANLC